MKILHCADIHLDARMETHLNKEKAGERQREILDTFLRMIQWAGEHGVEAVLIAGDLFDTRRVSKTSRRTIYEAMRGLPEIAFYYLRGNHDQNGMEEDVENCPPNLHFFRSHWTEYVLAEQDGRRLMLYGAEFTRENTEELHSSLMLRTEDCNIVMLHGQLQEHGGSLKEECISLSRLKNRGIDYLALGHIHKGADGHIDERGTWCYPGCLEGRGFDECGPHGFMLLEVDLSTRRITGERIPFASRILHELQVDVSGTADTPAAEALTEAAWEAAHIPARDMVKLILTGETEEGAELDTDYLWQRFQSRCFFLKVEDETAEAVNAGIYEGENSLRGAFVRRILQDDTLEEKEQQEILRTGLLALAGEWGRIEESL